MIDAGITKGKQILLIDKSTKQTNDRTWCFWEAQPGFFEPVVCKQWDHIWFHSSTFSQQFAIAPYRYKMIRGIDFYNYCFKRIKDQPGIENLQGLVENPVAAGEELSLTLDGHKHYFRAKAIFNSRWNQPATNSSKTIHLLQHFKGWMIETPAPFFTPGEATLMDFRVSQANGTTFVYVLPLTSTRALVEYTVFSEKLLNAQTYEEGLAAYLKDWLQLNNYHVAEEEFGVIPMTDAVFPWFADGMYHIGTAGGQTKGSSGYTFQFIQKQSAAIVAGLKENTLQPGIQPGKALQKFNFYDAVLLRVLAGGHLPGSEVFTHLFKKNSPQHIFAFLDNETSLLQDLSIIRSLPTIPFLKAAASKIFL